MSTMLDKFSINLKEFTFNAIFIWIVLVICFIIRTTKKLIQSSYISKNVHLLLNQAVIGNDIIECIRLIELDPSAINKPLPPENYTPFLRACLLGNTHLVRLMIKYGADLRKRTAKKETCFFLAVYSLIKEPHKRDASCIHALYHEGVDVDASNEKGFTPLQLAALFGHTSLVQWLLSKGANKNVIPDPFLMARLHGHKNTAAVLRTTRIQSIQE